eukprot:COSAG01_NODE_485_length_16397_cov_48.193827_28_plen_92_part_00
MRRERRAREHGRPGAVSHFLVWTGSPCLRRGVHGASIGGGEGPALAAGAVVGAAAAAVQRPGAAAAPPPRRQRQGPGACGGAAAGGGAPQL